MSMKRFRRAMMLWVWGMVGGGIIETDTFSLTQSGTLSLAVHFHAVDGDYFDIEITATLIKQ